MKSRLNRYPEFAETFARRGLELSGGAVGVALVVRVLIEPEGVAVLLTARGRP
ncbi:hypothetical protein [Microbacterium lushaniae]|uniref:hypothetical protein n=1 Tax=Microbacterium lushaniae TaxID=2614639 RepID=UPI001EE9A730|nr:hypothetical protein [Microbacterium lushaniae]